MVLDGKTDEASALYKKAIVFASRSGFIQDVALLNERYALFLKSRNISRIEVKYHFEKAILFYSEWGAVHRQKHIRDTHFFADGDLKM